MGSVSIRYLSNFLIVDSSWGNKIRTFEKSWPEVLLVLVLFHDLHLHALRQHVPHGAFSIDFFKKLDANTIRHRIGSSTVVSFPTRNREQGGKEGAKEYTKDYYIEITMVLDSKMKPLILIAQNECMSKDET